MWHLLSGELKTASLQQKEPAEAIWAYDQESLYTPPIGGFLGTRGETSKDPELIE